MFQFFHHSLTFTSLNQALLVFRMKTWQRKREEPRMGKGVGDSANGSVSQAVEQLILNLTVPLESKQPKWHHPWEHSQENRLLWNSRVLVICLHEINFSAPFAPSCAETTRELGCSALQELLAPLDAHKLQHWLELLDEAQAGAESQDCSGSVHTFISSPSPKFPLPALQHQC